MRLFCEPQTRQEVLAAAIGVRQQQSLPPHRHREAFDEGKSRGDLVLCEHQKAPNPEPLFRVLTFRTIRIVEGLFRGDTKQGEGIVEAETRWDMSAATGTIPHPISQNIGMRYCGLAGVADQDDQSGIISGRCP